MARTVHVVVTCDLCEGEVEATHAVRFGNDGYWFDMDLCDSHFDEYGNWVNEYIAVARKADADGVRSSSRRRAASPAASREDLTEMRAWAREHGYEVSDRGRIPVQVREAYQAAHA